jgi:hypothetical protein
MALLRVVWVKNRTAKNTIYFDATRPSAIVLPVVKQ